MRRLIVLRVNDNQNLLGSDRLPPRYLGNRRGRRTVLHSLLTLLPRFARDAVVRGWIRIHLRLSCPPFSSSVKSKIECERPGSFTCVPVYQRVSRPAPPERQS